MHERKHRVDPNLVCIHCGKRITAEDYKEAQWAYTNHVVQQHDMPSHASGDQPDVDDLASVETEVPTDGR